MDHVSETISELLGVITPAMAMAVASPKPAASSEEQQRAVESVQRLTGLKRVRLQFRAREQEPLSEGEPLILDTYVDGKDNEYWIEPHSGTVVQMGPESGRYSPPQPTGATASLSVRELRHGALQVVERQIKGFDALLPTLHPLEANDRRAVYFFRWEDLGEPLSESELPPFVQVGLYVDGSLASFADTISSTRDELPPNSDHITDLPESWSKTKKGDKT